MGNSIIEKELERGRQSSLNSASGKKSEDMKLLMETSAVEERKILREAGLDFNLRELESKVSSNMTREKNETRLDSKIFTEAEIKEACVKYDLRFLRSRYYKGSIEPTLGKVLLDFFKDRKIDGASYEASNNLYIMAPVSAFNLEEHPDPPVVDPVMFYKISTGDGDMYALIHKWGRDFTAVRRVWGAMRATSWNWFWTKTAFAFIVAMVGVALSTNPFTLLWMSVSLTVAVLVAGLPVFVRNGDTSDKWTNYRNSFSKRGWNSEKKHLGMYW
jgi:hypothetical protein